VRKYSLLLLFVFLISGVFLAANQITSYSDEGTTDFTKYEKTSDGLAEVLQEKDEAMPDQSSHAMASAEPGSPVNSSDSLETAEYTGMTDSEKESGQASEHSTTPNPKKAPGPASTQKPGEVQNPADAPKAEETPSPESVPPKEALEEIPQEYCELTYFDQDKYERYQVYKARNPGFGYEKVILDVNIGLDNPFYTGIVTIKDPDALNVLVNKYRKLPDTYAPELVELPKELCVPGTAKQYMRKEAKEAFERMHYDAKKLGLNITAYGTYRSIKTQHDIWNRKVNSGRSIEDVDRLNARGGHSEHNTGLAVDVIINDYEVEKTKEFEWYKDHAHEYGFIIRYPKGQEGITGYLYEPWHLRYLGVDLATKVYNSGLTYEAYYVMEIEPYLE
jgi:D-alanyl-D-alanine carboxypeptidase